jgi:hypothetical protein
MKKQWVLFCLAAWLAASAPAAPVLTPFQIGIWGPKVQIFPEQTRVVGLRLNLACSDNRDMTGLDLGLVGKAGRMDAIQINLANLVDEEFNGIGVGLFNQVGSVAGLQAGLFNNVAHDMSGFQLGLFNVADDATGFQIGLVNRTVSMRGVQIGLVNLIEDGPVTFFPILNASF